MTTAEVIRCPTCGANNRVPIDKIERGLTPVCGRCKAKLPIRFSPIVVTDSTFGGEVEQSQLPVLEHP